MSPSCEEPGQQDGAAEPEGCDTVVVGGGVIGWSCAWRAAQLGEDVVLFDPDPGGGASYVAAGMISPAGELHHGEEPLLRLGLLAAQGYPAFAAELLDATGVDVGLTTTGSLAVALDHGDRAVLDRSADLQERMGLRIERLTGRQARAMEPFLAPGVSAAVHLPDDHSVDNRRLLRALQAAAVSASVRHVRRRAGVRVRSAPGSPDRVVGVESEDGRAVSAHRVVLAAGSRSVPGVPDHVLAPIRPVKGQILRVQVPAPLRPLLSRTVRGTVQGSSVYLVPRRDGEVVVGATTEEQGEDQSVTVGGVYQLLRDAQALVPGLSEARLTESAARLRPAAPDNAPVVGATSVEGLLVAGGHYRGGVLMAGITGEAIARLLVDPRASTPFDDCSPARSRGPVPTWNRSAERTRRGDRRD